MKNFSLKWSIENKSYAKEFVSCLGATAFDYIKAIKQEFVNGQWKTKTIEKKNFINFLPPVATKKAKSWIDKMKKEGATYFYFSRG